MISVNHNFGGMLAQDALSQSHDRMQVSLERLSTGVRINRAEDDAAGLILRDRFGAQVNGFQEGIRNIQTGMGMIQVAEQGLNQVTQALQQMRALAVRASDDNLTDSDRQNIQKQVQGLLQEINGRANSTTYNGRHLLDGSITGAVAERQGGAQVQSNAILAAGGSLVQGAAVLGNGATQAGAVSQGSYEIKLAFDAAKRDHPVETAHTTLQGANSMGKAYLNSQGVAGTVVTRSEQVIDAQGNSHDVNFTFTSTGADTWNYRYSGGAGGTWTSALSTAGTLTFDAGTGALTGMTVAGSNATLTGTTVTQNIPDGTASGQRWQIDFSKLKNNSQPPVVDAPIEPPNGIAGSSETTQITFHSALDSTAAAGTVVSFTNRATVVDRLGQTHNVGFTFTKTVNNTGASENADSWDMSITNLTGGAYTGAQTNTTDVHLQFDASGNLIKVNGQDATSFDAFVGDGTATGQQIHVDLHLLQSVPGTSHIDPVANGSSDAETTAVNYTGNLERHEDVGFSTTLGNVTYYDRLGVAHNTSILFTKTATDTVSHTDTWSYQFQGLQNSGAWQGVLGGNTGTIVFNNDNGSIRTINGLAPAVQTLQMNDGQRDSNGNLIGQRISIDFSGLTQLGGSTDVTTVGQSTSNALTSTSSQSFPEILNGDAQVGQSTTATLDWYDRTGARHDVTATFTRQSGSGDGGTWSWSLAGAQGGAWTSALSTSGTLTFSGGTLIGSTGPSSVTVPDGAGGQTVALDFSGVSVNSAVYMYTTTPTVSVANSGNLQRDLATGSSLAPVSTTITDRQGVQHTLSLTYTKTGATSWSWAATLSNPNGSGAYPNGTAIAAGSSGALTYDDAGNLTSGGSATLAIQDTAGGHLQDIALDFTALTDHSLNTPPGSQPTPTITATDGSAAVSGTPTTTTGTITGALNESTVNQTMTMYDEAGNAHTVNLQLTRASGSNNDWSYAITAAAGGTWAGGITGATTGATGTLHFDNSTGTFTSASNSSMTVVNGTGADTVSQNIALEFSGLSSLVTAAPTSSGGTAVTGFTAISGNMDDGGGSTPSVSRTFTLQQPDGSTNTATITFTEATAGNNTAWNYTVTGFNGSAVSGSDSGTASFDAAGNLTAIDGVSGRTYHTLSLNLGASGSQSVNLEFGSLTAAVTHSGSTLTSATEETYNTSKISGTLDGDAAVGTLNAAKSLTATIKDKDGNSHTVTVQLTKALDNPGTDDIWNYQITDTADNTGDWANFSPTSGTVYFSGGATGAATTLNINDGTLFGQDVTFDFSGLTSATETASTASGSPDGGTGTNHTTQNASVTGSLSGDANVNDTVASTVVNVYDSLGVAHSLLVDFTKTATNQWSWSVAGPTADGAWSGGLASGGSGSLAFSDNGPGDTSHALISGGTGSVTINAEGTNQTVNLDFTSLVENLSGATDQVNSPAATNTTQTSAEYFQDVLDGGTPTGNTTTQQYTWYDHNDVAHAVTLTLEKTTNAEGLGDTYSYTLTGDGANGWSGGTLDSGSLTFDASGNLTSSATKNIIVADGTSQGQSIDLDFSAIHVVQDTQNAFGSASQPTSTATFGGRLGADGAVGTVETSSTDQWTDGEAVQHAVNVTYTKLHDNVWSYAINGLDTPGGAWTSNTAPANASGTLVFNDDGTLATLNGSSTLNFNLSIPDQSGAQSVHVDFSGLTQATSGHLSDAPGALVNAGGPDDSTVSGLITGSFFTVTNTVNFGSRVVSGAGPITFNLGGIVSDRDLQLAYGAKVVMTQVGDTNAWNYSVAGPTTDGFDGTVRGGTGTLTFTDSGDLIGPQSFVATFNDGTTTGQTVTFNMAALRMGRAADLAGTSTDGSQGSGDLQVNALIYFSGARGAGPVMTLSDVSAGAKTANLGGVSFTVGQVSSLDVGLSSYVKAYTYVSAVSGDQSLQFQVGPDEGMINHVGIARMDVTSLFRASGAYDFGSVDLSGKLQAEDLIGQIDDALNYAGAENLKVGQFQNHFSRTLDLARQQSTSISGTLSNINDADMATEATLQSRRMILVQSGTAMVAQANSTSQFLLQLLR